MKATITTTAKTMSILLLTCFVCQETLADIHYVDVNNGSPAAPYTNWATAARVIQDSVDAATAGDTVLVTDGVYSAGTRVTPGYDLSNRVVITKNIIVTSVNGPGATVILGAADQLSGGNGTNAVRGVYMSAGTLSGFTVSNGYTQLSSGSVFNLNGGGVWCCVGCVVNNCIISGNNAGVNNEAGGVECWQGGVINNSTISGNIAGSGGGVQFTDGGEMNNCIISGNFAGSGGGIRCAFGGVVNNCVISGNSTDDTGGGGVLCDYGGELKNCLIIDNSADNQFSANGGGVSCHNGGAVINCTISGNGANGVYEAYGGGAYCSDGGAFTNTIIYFNYATTSGDNWYNSYEYDTGSYAYCCTTPGLGGAGNITNDPEFVNLPGGDYCLLDISTCIDAGTNLPWMTGATDLDGNPRIYDGTVDMGCYEFIPEPFYLRFEICCLLLIILAPRMLGYRRRFIPLKRG